MKPWIGSREQKAATKRCIDSLPPRLPRRDVVRLWNIEARRAIAHELNPDPVTKLVTSKRQCDAYFADLAKKWRISRKATYELLLNNKTAQSLREIRDGGHWWGSGASRERYNPAFLRRFIRLAKEALR